MRAGPAVVADGCERPGLDGMQPRRCHPARRVGQAVCGVFGGVEISLLPDRG
jgi:hypothetical protein